MCLVYDLGQLCVGHRMQCASGRMCRCDVSIQSRLSQCEPAETGIIIIVNSVSVRSQFGNLCGCGQTGHVPWQPSVSISTGFGGCESYPDDDNFSTRTTHGFVVVLGMVVVVMVVVVVVWWLIHSIRTNSTTTLAATTNNHTE